MRADFLERADVIDGGVRKLLARLDLRHDDDHGHDERERVIDALMGVCRAADALRALAADDVTAADEATSSMAYYTRRALG